MDAVSLRVVAKDDMQTIWKMQIEAFSDLLHKYQDYDMSPGAESLASWMAVPGIT